MKRKCIAFLLTLLFVLTVALPAAFAGGSIFPIKFKVEEYILNTEIALNINYNSVYVNSKGDTWIPAANTESKDQSVVWMYKVDLKNDTVLEKVRIGEGGYHYNLYKPSPDGRYLYFPIAKSKLIYGFNAIDSWRLVCFDADEGKVVWDKYIKKCNGSAKSFALLTDYLPVQDGVIDLFTNDDDTGHTTVYKTIVLKMSVKGDKLWDVTIPGKFGIVTYDKGNLLLSDGKKLLSLDTRTGIYEEEGKLSIEVNAPEQIANRGTPTFSDDTVYYVSKATDVQKEWRLYRFTRSNGKNKLVEIVSHLPVRDDPCPSYFGKLFMYAVYDGYFVFTDSVGNFHDQNIYVYDKNGKLLWHRDVRPGNPKFCMCTVPIFAKGMLFYAEQDVVHAVDMKTGEDVYEVYIGNFEASFVDAVEDDGTIFVDALNTEDLTKSTRILHLFKITEEKALLTVNTNVKDGSFDIIQKDKKETVKFGSKVELPPGNYTLHFHSLDGVSGVKAPDDINVSLKDNENKVLNVEYKDIEPPVITVEPISQPTVMGGVAYFTIKGTVKDNFSGVKSVSVNGTEVSIDKDGSFSKTVIVHEKGMVTFVISAEDNAGNRADKTLTADYNPPIVIRLKPNSKMFFVNETAKILDSPPVIIPKWNRTVVPIRAIVEALGGTVSWDPVQRMVTINLGDNMINLWIGKPQAMVNGVMKWIDDSNHNVKPIIINNRTMLPLRFVAENLGCTVEWDNNTRTITIKYIP